MAEHRGVTGVPRSPLDRPEHLFEGFGRDLSFEDPIELRPEWHTSERPSVGRLGDGSIQLLRRTPDQRRVDPGLRRDLLQLGQSRPWDPRQRSGTLGLEVGRPTEKVADLLVRIAPLFTIRGHEPR